MANLRFTISKYQCLSLYAMKHSHHIILKGNGTDLQIVMGLEEK